MIYNTNDLIFLSRLEKHKTESRVSDSASMTINESFDDEFEANNLWQLTTLDWCKCGQSQTITKTIESKS